MVTVQNGDSGIPWALKTIYPKMPGTWDKKKNRKEDFIETELNIQDSKNILYVTEDRSGNLVVVIYTLYIYNTAIQNL